MLTLVQPNHIPRIVRRDESLFRVHLEAIQKGLYVWSDGRRHTVISRDKPSEKYHKLHANFHCFGPEVA